MTRARGSPDHSWSFETSGFARGAYPIVKLWPLVPAPVGVTTLILPVFAPVGTLTERVVPETVLKNLALTPPTLM